MRNHILIYAVAFSLGGAAGGALAAGTAVHQKDKMFSETEMVIKKGGTVTFVNDDNITHNVMSNSRGNEFNIGAQAPGVSTPVQFTTAGAADVFCAIHPRMRMAIKITE